MASCIRNLGNCPCPRCLTPLSLTHRMGLQEDLSRRKKLRKDDATRRDIVEKCVKMIHEKGRPVSCKAVEDLMQPESWVPITVIHHLWVRVDCMVGSYLSIECVLVAIINAWLWFISHVCTRYYAQVWFGCLEVYLYSPPSHSVIHQGEQTQWTESPVRITGLFH